MIVRQLEKIIDSDRDVDTKTWNSRRLLLADDKMGFSMHDTIIRAGYDLKMHYQNHLEAVYCIEGEGEIHDLETDEIHPIKVGTIYALDKHDRHILRGKTDMRMVCVFNPPVTGKEVHDESGAYPAAEPAAAV